MKDRFTIYTPGWLDQSEIRSKWLTPEFSSQSALVAIDYSTPESLTADWWFPGEGPVGYYVDSIDLLPGTDQSQHGDTMAYRRGSIG